jgi:hypothetical protein
VCNHFDGSGGMGTHPDVWIDVAGKTYCAIDFGSLHVDEDIPPSGQQTDRTDAQQEALKMTVKDENVDKAIAQFTKPDFYLVVTHEKFAQSTNCAINEVSEINPDHVLVANPAMVSTCKETNRS